MAAFPKNNVLTGLALFVAGALWAPVLSAQTACFGRDYSDEHLRAHPNQTVYLIRMLFDGRARKSDEVGVTMQVAVKFKDAQSEYLTEIMICDQAGETVWCGVECDGGGVELSWEGADKIRAKTQGFVVNSSCGSGPSRVVKDKNALQTIYALSRASDDACSGLKIASQP